MMIKQLILKDNLKSTLDVNGYLQLENKCQELLKDDAIRFVGMINHMGQLISGGFAEGVDLVETDEKRRMLYMQMALEIAMRKEFDDTLGKINYIATNRNKVLMITIPMDDHVILISAEPTYTADQIIAKAHDLELFPPEI